MPSSVIHSVAGALSEAGALRVLFPLLALVGPAVFFYFGHMGITQRKTLLLGRRNDKRLSPAIQLEGTSAVICGVIYIAAGLVIAGVMLPIAGAMFGLW